MQTLNSDYKDNFKVYPTHLVVISFFMTFML